MGLESVEPLGVASKNRNFLLVRKRIVFDRLLDLINGGFEVDFVRVVRRVGEGLDPHPACQVREGRIDTLAANEEITASEVLLRRARGSSGKLGRPLYPVQSQGYPCAAALEKCDSHIWELLEHPVVDEGYERIQRCVFLYNPQRHRMVDDAGRREIVERVNADSRVRATVDGENAA